MNALAFVHRARALTAPWLALLFALVSAKAAIAIQLARDEESLAPVLWLGSALGGELVLASGWALCAALFRHTAARALLAIVAVLAAAWMDANIISYAVDQSPITWWRLRGGDGGGLEALDLLEPDDVVGVIVLAFAQAAIATWLVTRAAPALNRRARAPWLGLAAGLVLLTVDAGFAHAHNRGLGEQPVAVLVLSVLEGWGEEAATRSAGGGDLASLSADGAAHDDADAGDREAWSAWVREASPAGARRPALARAEAPARNAIVFFAEGVPRELTTLGDPTLETTPLLAARAKRSGVELGFHHATFHRSIAALFSFACSDYPPPDGAGIPEVNPRADCGEISQLLAPAGIRSGFFHSGPFGFYDKLAFFGGRNWDVLRDAASFDDDGVWRHRWGVDDRATVGATLDWIDTLGGDRFFAFVVPIAAHYPYEVPPDFPPARGTKRERFLASVAYLDVVFEELMAGLEARGLDDDTLVVFLADHGAIFPRAAKKVRGARLAYEGNLHVPAVLFGAPTRGPTRYDALTSHLDVMPTVLDALGVAADARHVGRSLFTEAPATRVFVGARSGRSEIVGYLEDRMKVLVHRRSGIVEAYDLARDPDEQRDLAVDWPRERRTQARADALRFAAGQARRLREARTLGDDIDVPAAVLERATVAVLRSGAAQECARADGAWRCPGEAAPVLEGRREASVDGVTRDCLIVRPPARAAVRIRLDRAPALLSFLSQARLGRLEDTQDDARYQLTVRSDGRSSSDVDATHGARGRLASGDDVAQVSYAPASEQLDVVVYALDDASDALCLAFDDKSWRARADHF